MIIYVDILFSYILEFQNKWELLQGLQYFREDFFSLKELERDTRTVIWVNDVTNGPPVLFYVNLKMMLIVHVSIENDILFFSFQLYLVMKLE